MNFDEGFIAGIREWINEGAGRYVAIGAVAVVVLGAGWMTYSCFGGGPRAEEVMAEGRPVLVICEACGKSGKTNVGWMDPFPVVCPECKEKQAYEAILCERCNTTFRTPRQPVFRCPKCGAEFITEQALGGDR
ncbi:MAG TPA: hypothetical protein VM389_12890 [Phycisphaerae bacterium]|nr:hypothetical protein [Phycisphaerae bacterium]